MRIYQSVRLWILLFGAAITVSGCATIEGYRNDKVEYDRQARQNENLVRQYSEDIRQLNDQQMAYEKTLADEAKLNDENVRLRRRIATVESKLNDPPAVQQTPPASAFKKLGEIIPAQTYELALKEQGYYSRLEDVYNKQLKALSSYQDGSPEHRRETEIIRAQALLDVISEAFLVINIVREALLKSTLVDVPSVESALINLAPAQDHMLAALNYVKLQGQDQADSNSSIAHLNCADMRATIQDLIRSLNRSLLRDDTYLDLMTWLITMEEVTRTADELLSRKNALMDDRNYPRTSFGSGLPKTFLISDQFITKNLSFLISCGNYTVENVGQPINSTTHYLKRIQWILSMSTYCQGDAFKPERYLEVRLGEIRPLNAAALEIIKSYNLVHAQP